VSKKKTLLEQIEEREQHHKAELVEIEKQRKKLIASLQEKAAIATMAALYKFRDNFHKKVLADFNAVNKCLAELASISPGYVHAIESMDLGTPESKQEIKYIVGYLFGGKWDKDASLWPILGQISDTIDMSNNPFRGDTDG